MIIDSERMKLVTIDTLNKYLGDASKYIYDNVDLNVKEIGVKADWLPESVAIGLYIAAICHNRLRIVYVMHKTRIDLAASEKYHRVVSESQPYYQERLYDVSISRIDKSIGDIVEFSITTV